VTLWISFSSSNKHDLLGKMLSKFKNIIANKQLLERINLVCFCLKAKGNWVKPNESLRKLEVEHLSKENSQILLSGLSFVRLFLPSIGIFSFISKSLPLKTRG
jgi:hypothetical protein